MESQWFIVRGDKQYGPYEESRLREWAAAGKIVPADQLRKEGMKDWILASQVTDLFPDGEQQKQPIPREEIAQRMRPFVASWSQRLRGVDFKTHFAKLEVRRRIAVLRERIALADSKTRRKGLLLGATIVTLLIGTVLALRSDGEHSANASNDATATDIAQSSIVDSGKPASLARNYFRRSSETLDAAASAAANFKSQPGTERSAEYQEALYRGMLLNDIASAQAGIGDFDGVETTINHLRMLKSVELSEGGRVPIAIGQAIIASFVAQARAGNQLNVKNALSVIEAEFPVDGDKQKALLLRQIAIAYAHAGDSRSADSMLTELKSYANSVVDPVGRIDSLNELALAQIALCLHSDAIATLDMVSKSNSGDVETLAATRRSFADIGPNWASVGESEKAEEYLGRLARFGAGDLADLAYKRIAASRARSLDFRGALGASAKIESGLFRTLSMLEVHQRQLECGPIFIQDALSFSDLLADSVKRELSATQVRQPTWHSELRCEAACTAAKWQLTRAALRLSPALAKVVTNKIVSATVDVSRATTDEKLEPEYRAKVELTDAVIAAFHEEDRAGSSFRECLRRAAACSEIDTRLKLLPEIGKGFQSAKRSDDALAWARTRSTFDEAAILFGIAMQLRAEEEPDVAVEVGLKIAGEPKLIQRDDSARNDSWQWFVQRIPKGAIKGENRDAIVLTADSYLLAIPVERGLILAIPPTLSGLSGLFALDLGAVFSDDEATRVLDLFSSPVGTEFALGRFSAKKHVAEFPDRWIVVRLTTK